MSFKVIWVPCLGTLISNHKLTKYVHALLIGLYSAGVIIGWKLTLEFVSL